MLAIPQRPSADIRIAATPAPRRPQRQASTVEDLAQRVGIPLRKVRIKESIRARRGFAAARTLARRSLVVGLTDYRSFTRPAWCGRADASAVFAGPHKPGFAVIKVSPISERITARLLYRIRRRRDRRVMLAHHEYPFPVEISPNDVAELSPVAPGSVGMRMMKSPPRQWARVEPTKAVVRCATA